MSNILEKPDTREENLRMLQELNGKSCEVVTGVTVRKQISIERSSISKHISVFPVITAPGYKLQ